MAKDEIEFDDINDDIRYDGLTAEWIKQTVKIERIIKTIFDELYRAEDVYPSWPDDIVHQAAIVAEEAGELLQAANNHRWSHKPCTLADIEKEAVQTAAMAIRFLKNLKEYHQ